VLLNLTPRPVVRQGLIYLRDQMGVLPKVVIDPSAGAGVFGAVAREVWPKAHLVGIELDADMAALAQRNYDEFHHGDFETYAAGASFNDDALVTSNPPFEHFARFEGPKTDPQLKSWVPIALKLAPLVWLYGKESVGIRIQSQEQLFAALPPVLETRVSGYVRHRGRGVGSDSHAYAWWLWVVSGQLQNMVTGWLPAALEEMPAGTWPTLNLPRLPAMDRTWVNTMPGQEGVPA
jgi:hypothetical protein